MTQSNNSHHYGESVRADKLRLLYNRPFPAVALTAIAAVIYSNIIWLQVESNLLFIWLGIIVFVSIVRVALFVAFDTQKPLDNDVLKWETPYFVTLMLSSLSWGLGLVWLMLDLPFLYQAITCFMLVGIAGSALSTYSTMRYIAVSTLLVVLTPMVVFLLFSGEKIQILITLSALLFIVGGIRASRISSNALHCSFVLTHALSRAKEEAEKLASIDMLTEINNRRAFTRLAKVQVDYCKRHESPVSAIVLDADHFKNINDTHGHAAGDTALQHLANILKELTRSSDIIGRIGGEEFAILLTNTNIGDAKIVAEKLKSWIADNPVHFDDNYFPITVSIGVASDESYNLESLLNHADKAMYIAKQFGRNQVICHED